MACCRLIRRGRIGDSASRFPTLATSEIALKPIRKWEIHLIPQSHLDIGYTHTQPEVLKLQVEYLRTAPDDIDRSKMISLEPSSGGTLKEVGGRGIHAHCIGCGKGTLCRGLRSQHIHLDVLMVQGMTGL